MPKEIKNTGASVRGRLLNFSQANRQNFDLMLTRFALERLLFRLSRSPYAERFVLKGAMLLMSRSNGNGAPLSRMSPLILGRWRTWSMS